MILAIDTSTNVAGVAVTDGESVLGEIIWTSPASHSSQLATSLRRLLEASGTSLSQVDGIAVASGPGSFSGLRVGISAVKGLALALDVPVAGISTLDIIAWQVSLLAPRVLAVIPAGRSQMYAALYDGSGARWQRIRDPEILALDMAASLGADVLIAGDGAEAVSRALRSQGREASLAPGPWNLRRPGFLAELGRLYFQSGGPDQSDRLEPLYLRRSAAEEKRAAVQG